MLPTKAMRMDRFRVGLITLLYNLLTVTKFPSLSKLIDKAKQLEARYNEDREKRKQRKQLFGKT